MILELRLLVALVYQEVVLLGSLVHEVPKFLELVELFLQAVDRPFLEPVPGLVTEVGLLVALVFQGLLKAQLLVCQEPMGVLVLV